MDYSTSFIFLTLPVAALAGFLGALLGIGGGVILIPFLVLFMGVPIQYAIAAGMVAVIATSTGSAISYVKGGVTNLKLSMFLEAGTVAGALIGAMLASRLPANILELLFALVLLICAYSMFSMMGRFRKTENDKLAQHLELHSHYHDAENGRTEYGVTNSVHGLLGSVVAGCAACLFGIGGGVIKVPLMNNVMRVPIKVAAATSNFMIGVTAATGAIVFMRMGYVVPEIVAPVALGVMIGSLSGSRVSKKLKPDALRKLFVILLIYVGIKMALKGAGVDLGI